MHHYLSFNRFLKSRFGERVQKIPLDAGLGCPNRDGTKGTEGCIYCDPLGSGTGAEKRGLSIHDQMRQGIIWAERRYNAKKFIPYFQSFSNTYAPLPVLEQLYTEAAGFPGVAGIAIGTRPDCITHEILDLVGNTARGGMVWMEYGLQSASNRTLQRINRGHTVEDFVQCVKLTRKAGFLVCAHVIFGLPDQSVREIQATVDLIAELGVEGIKFHNLYMVKGTKIYKMYKEKPFPLMSQKRYAELVVDSIRRLPHGTVVQRLTGDPPRTMGPALPAWSHDRQGTIRLIEQGLEAAGQSHIY